MFEKISNIFRIPDLRTRVLFTLGLLAVYRVGAHIPTPGINAKMLAEFFNNNSQSALGLVDLFSGGNLRKLTICLRLSTSRSPSCRRKARWGGGRLPSGPDM